MTSSVSQGCAAQPGLVLPQGLAGIIFDCDGVIIDSRAANAEYFNKILACFDLPPMTAEQEEFSFMSTARQAMLHILPEHVHGQIDEVVRDKIKYSRDILPLLHLMPGFREFVEDAHTAGLRLAVATNRAACGIQTVLDFFALPPYFDPVISASDACPKPSPEGALRICAAWNVAPERVLFVGDSPHDRDAAAAAGTRFAAFTTGGLTGDITAASYDELRLALACAPPLGRD